MAAGKAQSKLNTAALLYLLILFLKVQNSKSSNSTRPRVVFPFDSIKLNCMKHYNAKADHGETCTWTFLDDQNQTISNVTQDCTKRTDSMVKKLPFSVFEGYVQVPEKATAVACTESDVPDTIIVQQLKVAKPITSYESSLPTIVLQRFSEDYSARLAAHDVTGQEVVIDGNQVESVRLLCIYGKMLEWTNVTMNKKRVNVDLKERDQDWLKTKSHTEREWKQQYLKFIIGSATDSPKKITLGRDDMENSELYILPLMIRNITNETSRMYECRSLDKGDSSIVTLAIENPRVAGPDEIEMIQQIVAILDSLAQGKGKGNEPWYTLASLLSIILVMFIYYCKLKLQQGRNPPNQCPPKAPEETEMTRLQVSIPAQSDPVGIEASPPPELRRPRPDTDPIQQV